MPRPITDTFSGLRQVPILDEVTADPAVDRLFNNLTFSKNWLKDGKTLRQLSALNLQDRFGSDLSHVGAIYNRPLVLKYLHARGIDLQRPNSLGLKPIHYAVLMGSRKSITMLAEISPITNEKFPPLTEEIINSLPMRFRTKFKRNFEQTLQSAKDNSQTELDLLDFAVLSRLEESAAPLIRTGLTSSHRYNGTPFWQMLASSFMLPVTLNYLEQRTPDEIQQINLSCLGLHGRNNPGIVDAPIKTLFTDSLSQIRHSEDTAQQTQYLKVLLQNAIQHYLGSEYKERFDLQQLSPLGCLKLYNFIVAVFEYWSEFREIAISHRPELLRTMETVSTGSRLNNAHFGAVCFAAAACAVTADPSIEPISNESTFKIISSSAIEHSVMAQPWSNFTKQKILANKLLTVGLNDIVTEYARAVIYPCLVNCLLTHGHTFSDIWSNNKFKSIANQIAFRHIVGDKSIGSIFRFNSLWHRPDMRLPDAACPGLANQTWHPIFREKVWNHDSEYSVVEITSGAELTDEGERMNHCVRTRAHECSAGHSHVFSVRKAGKSICTIETSLIKGSKGEFIDLRDKEKRGHSNGPTPPDAMRTWEEFKRAIRKNPNLIQVEQIGFTDQSLLEENHREYLSFTYHKVGEFPIEALKHYEAMRLFMNRSEQQKFIVGAFRDNDFEISKLIANDILEALREIPNALESSPLIA